ncbi:MAG: helix-turn-helix transcriptional regulator [Alphaproteobacteria bacterium]|nr:helix-turn-helix transcriptional regulator [Alphaproteobacteria bacterium]
MLALPLPMLTFILSAVACVLVWRLDIGNHLARNLFTVVFALVTVSTLLIGLRFGYGLSQFIIIQRIIPLFVGPFIYLGFAALIQSKNEMHRTISTHVGVAVVAAILPQIIPQIRPGFDFVIGASYLFYCIALLILWRKGGDSLAYAPLDMSRSLRQWMLGSAAMLAIMLVFDTVIAINFAMRRSDEAIQLISYGSVISMIGLIIAIIVISKGTSRRSGTKSAYVSQESESAKLESSARSLLIQSQLYLDTDLTLARLAKRLHVPARALSEAINQTQKMNVSQYVNGFRLRHAIKLLETSDLNVTQVMEQSGFLSRSNFYREFERIYALSPVEYRAHQFELKTAP